MAYIQGYWDADNVIRAFCWDSGGLLVHRSEHAPSDHLLSGLRELAATRLAAVSQDDATCYRGGWEDRVAEWKRDLDEDRATAEGGDHA